MQPVLTQVPPNLSRSMMATVMPLAFRGPVSEGPACPAPITIASKFCVIFQPSNEVRATDGTRHLAAWKLPNDTRESTAIKLDYFLPKSRHVEFAGSRAKRTSGPLAWTGC